MRYAIYFTPGQDDPLTRVAASWLGRDPFSAAHPTAPDVTGLSPAEIAYHTASARRYGFHATLKAPFHLAENATEAELDDAVARFAAGAEPILLSGLDDGNDLERWGELAPQDDQLVAALHVDDGAACGERCWDRVVTPLADRFPVLTTDVRATDPLDGWVAGYLRWADSHGIGSLLGVWAEQPGDPQALVSDLAGRPTASALVKSTSCCAREPNLRYEVIDVTSMKSRSHTASSCTPQSRVSSTGSRFRPTSRRLFCALL